MAIAGLYNVPVLEPTIVRESQSSSSSSARYESQRRISTTSVLQMWRELEEECAVNRANERGRLRSQQDNSDSISNCPEEMGRGASEDFGESENGSLDNFESQMGLLNEHEDRQSMTSEQSQDIGEVERVRVRQIFREWMNSGVNAQTSNVSLRARSSRAQLLGENERESVRIVREWIQTTSQHRDALAGNREEQVGEIGSQIEDVRDGQVLGRYEGQAENSRRGFRRLCGRQFLVDLLVKKEQERRLELQHLEEARPVSGFTHRNRIQSLLRLKCFQYMRSVENEITRPSSAAETELGLLRQRQTVSGLREGFLSRLNNDSHTQTSDLSEGPSNNRLDCLRENQMHCCSNAEILYCAHEQSEPNGDGEVGLSVDLNHLSQRSIGETNLPELAVEEEAGLDQALENGEPSSQETATASNSNGCLDDETPVLNLEEPSGSEGAEFNNLEVANETFTQQYDTDSEEINIYSQSGDEEGREFRDVNGQESNMLVEDRQGHVTEDEERESEGSILSNQWRHDNEEEADRSHWPADGEESSRGVLENSREQNDVQEDYWHENASQETPRDWMGMPSGPGGTSSGRDDAYYFSDDDNLYNMELRELLNRRTVSSLLHSGFRESLDQLIQSYLERQTHVPDDWDLHQMSPPPFTARHQEQLAIDLNGPGAGGRTRQVLHRPTVAPQRYRAHALHHANWSRHEIRQHPGTDWEIINDLRIDMARLQQRLNNMEKMLEACMDMQLELQRAVRQEVSAALNRSTTNQSESLESKQPRDSLKWDSVRKGMCCICSESNIDSLLYRCGHMCTCTKCANVLVQANGKCPMCQAPVIELFISRENGKCTVSDYLKRGKNRKASYSCTYHFGFPYMLISCTYIYFCNGNPPKVCTPESFPSLV